ncbi:hypothetical protein M422DRAFT_775208 [Sphaerobolus stellatus SS14]|nr:hypothetical protein M422DRAFT_775208 [Sphaerobolus stellatus SS14]
MLKLYLKGYTVDTDLFQHIKGEAMFDVCLIFMGKVPREERACIDVVYDGEGNPRPMLTRTRSNNREELEQVSIAPLNSALRAAFEVKIFIAVFSG